MIAQVQQFLLVAAGGAVGSVLRFSLQLSFAQFAIPYGTALANFSGCLLAGFCSAAISNANAKVFVVSGILGGLTTFSGLILEFTQMAQENQNKWAWIYLLFSLILGTILALLGYKLAEYAKL